MHARNLMTGALAVLALATVVVSCGSTGGGGSGDDGGTTQQFILNSNNSGRLNLNVSPAEVDANKSDRIGLTAILTDSLGHGVAGATITFSTDLNESDIIRDLGDVTFIPGVGPDNLTGTAVTDANGRADDLDAALGQYSSGFLALAEERARPHGSAAIPHEFARFRDVFEGLPPSTRRRWFERLFEDWVRAGGDAPSISLSARLEELY